MSHTIHAVVGEKGGVGKSVVALALLHTLRAEGKKDIIVLETDRSNGDVGRACEGKAGYQVVTPYISENPSEIGKADEVIEAVLLHSLDAVMNSPAQSHRATVQWLKEGSAELALEEGLSFRLWFITSGEYDSVSLFLQSLEDVHFPHVLVRNRHFIDKLTYDYSDVSRNKTLKTAVDRYHVPIVEFPAFVPSDIDIVRSHALTFDEAICSEHLKLAEKSRIRRAIRTFSQTIAEVLAYGTLANGSIAAVTSNGNGAEGTEPGAPRKGSRRQNRQAKEDGVGDCKPNGN